MSEFYQVLTSVCVIITFTLFIALVFTFSPVEHCVKLIKALGRKNKDRRIRSARQTVERYQPSAVLTENEIKALVLEFLDENQMIVNRGGCPYGYGQSD